MMDSNCTGCFFPAGIETKLIIKKLLVLLVVLIPTAVQAGEFTEWVKAAAVVYLSHENGHQQRSASRADMTWSYKNGGVIPDYSITLGSLIPHVDTTEGDFDALRRMLEVIPPEKLNVSDEIKKRREILVQQIVVDMQADKATNDGIDLINQTIIHNNNRLLGTIAGGGFVAQQEAIESLPEGEFKRKTTVLSAVFKGSYVIYSKYWCNGIDYTGDIVRMQRVAPVNLISTALMVSAITDYWRASQENMPTWRIDFVSEPNTGAVGLAYASRF